jgi:hypothetical protein
MFKAVFFNYDNYSCYYIYIESTLESRLVEIVYIYIYVNVSYRRVGHTGEWDTFAKTLLKYILCIIIQNIYLIIRFY